MEFLVHIELKFPPDMSEQRMQGLYEEEAARAAELASAGVLKRLWRLPGQRANIGLWEAPSASVLHDALMSWPMFAFMKITVTALAVSSKDPGRDRAAQEAALADYELVRAAPHARIVIEGQ
jgi:muconolactone delta-isomerase